MPFVKMHGIGNDFVMLNCFPERHCDLDWPSLSREMCDRRFGIGADGLILVEPGETAPFRMRMYNPDGSESEMCGNGIRCYARFALDQGLTACATIPVETGAGLLTLEALADGRVRVDMGLARLTRGEIGMEGDPNSQCISESITVDAFSGSGTAVSMGNPHLVFFVPDVACVDLERIGPTIEHSPLFPKRVNVHFVQVVDRSHLIQRTWERGAGITLACGTGACACLVAAFLNGLADRKAEIALPGGRLEIEYCEEGRVFMTGPAETVFHGEWP
ncbi:MAG: diaminopimelate epimerase [Armatimonadetes bacterium]|nr:diaminopimelate epimerase [Armatimonadota bacterium]